MLLRWGCNISTDTCARSFLFAEVFKYFYLIFEKPTVVSLDEYVFGTECHPYKIQGGTCAT